MIPIDKLLKARKLIIEFETDMVKEKGFCQYEVGDILRNLDKVIDEFKKNSF